MSSQTSKHYLTSSRDEHKKQLKTQITEPLSSAQTDPSSIEEKMNAFEKKLEEIVVKLNELERKLEKLEELLG